MPWFQRQQKKITTPTEEKRDAPDMWHKTPSGAIILKKELRDNNYVCPDDGYHERIGPEEYFSILFDEGKFTEINAGLVSQDPLTFVDTKAYPNRIEQARRKTGDNDAIRTVHGKMNGMDLMVACMNFRFVGGSMGSVMGEKIARAIDYSLDKKVPLLIISQSGGARMQEAGYSLMQMAKTSSKLALLHEERIPYLSLLTNPTTGGVTASFAMLGDLNLAEPGALIGFAGPRIIRDMSGKDLPKGFQTSEFLLQHGFVDKIVDRRHLKQTLTTILQLLA